MVLALIAVPVQHFGTLERMGLRNAIGANRILESCQKLPGGLPCGMFEAKTSEQRGIGGPKGSDTHSVAGVGPGLRFNDSDRFGARRIPFRRCFPVFWAVAPRALVLLLHWVPLPRA